MSCNAYVVYFYPIDGVAVGNAHELPKIIDIPTIFFLYSENLYIQTVWLNVPIEEAIFIVKGETI